MGPQLLPAHDLAGMFQKDLEDFQRLLLQFDPDALPSQFRLLQVEFEDTELHAVRTGWKREHPQITCDGVYHRLPGSARSVAKLTAHIAITR